MRSSRPGRGAAWPALLCARNAPKLGLAPAPRPLIRHGEAALGDESWRCVYLLSRFATSVLPSVEVQTWQGSLWQVFRASGSGGARERNVWGRPASIEDYRWGASGSFLVFRERRLRFSGPGQVLPYLRVEKTRGLSGQAVGRLTGGPFAVWPSEADGFSVSQVKGSIRKLSWELPHPLSWLCSIIKIDLCYAVGYNTMVLHMLSCLWLMCVKKVNLLISHWSSWRRSQDFIFFQRVF